MDDIIWIRNLNGLNNTIAIQNISNEILIYDAIKRAQATDFNRLKSVGVSQRN